MPRFSVLDLMLHSYAFMVSGLFVPVLGALFWKRGTAPAALASMASGGGSTVLLELSGIPLPLGLNANFFGLGVSALAFVSVSLLGPPNAGRPPQPRGPEAQE